MELSGSIAVVQPTLYTRDDFERFQLRPSAVMPTTAIVAHSHGSASWRAKMDHLRGTTDGLTMIVVDQVVSVLNSVVLNLTVREDLSAAPSQDRQGDALRSIKQMSGLPKTEIAEILGVTRQSVDAWSHGQRITFANYKRVLTVEALLIRASERHARNGDLRTWLVTPRGIDGRSPLELLKEGQFDRVRYLASLPSDTAAAPPAWIGRVKKEPREFINEPVPFSDDDEEPLLPMQD